MSRPTAPSTMTMLAPYRVLDLTDERGLLCAKMLADLGADVIQVEPPAGNSARRLAPFLGDEPGSDRSFFWWSYAANKRSITLDLACADGRALFERLVASAHFVIECGRPGEMAALGLSYERLAAINPALIVVSITPFGQTGPYATWLASDLVGMGLGGFICTSPATRIARRCASDFRISTCTARRRRRRAPCSPTRSVRSPAKASMSMSRARRRSRAHSPIHLRRT
ncbi:MAG: hypothetical protein GEV05_00350 [Betaproteobacteria bacterium]|nr:hypothetical protein [Betaproteobacteria bacterium]